MGARTLQVLVQLEFACWAPGASTLAKELAGILPAEWDTFSPRNL